MHAHTTPIKHVVRSRIFISKNTYKLLYYRACSFKINKRRRTVVHLHTKSMDIDVLTCISLKIYANHCTLAHMCSKSINVVAQSRVFIQNWWTSSYCHVFSLNNRWRWLYCLEKSRVPSCIFIRNRLTSLYCRASSVKMEGRRCAVMHYVSFTPLSVLPSVLLPKPAEPFALYINSRTTAMGGCYWYKKFFYLPTALQMNYNFLPLSVIYTERPPQ